MSRNRMVINSATPIESNVEGEDLNLSWDNLPKTMFLMICGFLPDEMLKNVLPLVSKRFYNAMHKYILHSAYGKSLDFSAWLDKEFEAALTSVEVLKKNHAPLDVKRNLLALMGPLILVAILCPDLLPPFLYAWQKQSVLEKITDDLERQQFLTQYEKDYVKFADEIRYSYLLPLIVFGMLITGLTILMQAQAIPNIPVMRRLLVQPAPEAKDEKPLLTDIIKFDRQFSTILGEEGAWMLALPPTMTIQEFLDQLTTTIQNVGCRVIDLKKELKRACSPLEKTLNLEKVDARIRPYASSMISFWQRKSASSDDNALLPAPKLKGNIAKRFN